jgi:hypothetical protein
LQQVQVILDQLLDVDELRGMLRMRRAQLEAQLSQDVSRLARVEARLRLIESEGHMTTTKIETKSVPEVHVVGMSAVAASDLPCQEPRPRAVGRALRDQILGPPPSARHAAPLSSKKLTNLLHEHREGRFVCPQDVVGAFDTGSIQTTEKPQCTHAHSAGKDFRCPPSASVAWA